MENISSSDVEVLTYRSITMPLLKSEEKITDKFFAEHSLERKKYFCFKDRDRSYMINKHNKASELNKSDKSFVIREYNDNIGNNAMDRARNTSLDVFYKGAEILNKSGLRPVRIGASSLLRCSSDSILDYSFSLRDEKKDIIDISLVANSKFLATPPTGDYLLAVAFNVPVFMLNSFPWPYINVPFVKGSMYMPKKLWLKKEKRFMKISEIASLESKYKRVIFSTDSFYDETGIETVENNEDEIKNGLIEMNDRLDGVWDTKRDIYKNYLTKDNVSYKSKAILSTSFLELNPNLV
jgi:putative glycosyltransferase (TIGR04372 family)